jgi:hypothetical protein
MKFFFVRSKNAFTFVFENYENNNTNYHFCHYNCSHYGLQNGNGISNYIKQFKKAIPEKNGFFVFLKCRIKYYENANNNYHLGHYYGSAVREVIV